MSTGVAMVPPFVRAMRCGAVAEMERLIAEPHVMGPAKRAEAWIAAQASDDFMLERGRLDRYNLAQELAVAVYGDNYHEQGTPLPPSKRQRLCDSEYAWLIAYDGSFQVHSFESRSAAYDSAAWLLSSPLVETTPKTIKWMLTFLATNAAEHGDVAMVEMLLESSVFRTAYCGPEESQFLELLALAWAYRQGPAQDNAKDFADVLLAHGASIEHVQAKVDAENSEFARFLVQQGARIIPLKWGKEGYSDPVHHNYYRALVEAGVDPRTHGIFAWRGIIRSGTVEAVGMLLDEWYVDIDAKLAIYDNYESLLMHALWREDSGTNATVVKMILDRGADLTAKNRRGKTALAVAVWLGKLPAVQLLLEYGSDPYQRDDAGQSVYDLVRQKAPGSARESMEALLRQHRPKSWTNAIVFKTC